MKIFPLIISLFLFLIPLESIFAQEVIKEQPEPQKEETFSKHYIFFTLGYGFRTAPTAEGIEGDPARHVNGLKKGLNIHAGFAFFPSPNLGPSVKYTQFLASNTTRNVHTEINILFVGGGIATRAFTSSNTLINASLHLGYVGYRQSDAISGQSGTLTGQTVGMEGAAQVNILLSRQLSLQFGIGYQLAALKRVKDSAGNSFETEEAESLDRIDLNSGFKLHF